MKIKIIGGLGNQMFQYASAYAFSKELNKDLIVDISDAIKYKVHPLRLTKLSCSSRYQKKSLYIEKYIYNVIDYRIKKLIFPYCYIEKNLCFNSKILDEIGNKKLVGYFQCSKYFEKYRNELLLEFKPKAEYSEYQKRILEEIKRGNNCSLHIRRGDYITNLNANSVHGTCDEKYFVDALKYLKEQNILNETSKIFIFSDDIKWCQENINMPYQSVFVQGDNICAELDMWLMSSCENNIISNSTFSWWAGWINNNSNKVVIAPKVWFKNGMENDIIPDEWIKL